MISHDFTWFHMMHILMHESSKSSWDMWSIAWSWVPGSKGVWNLEGAQPWEPTPSSSPNSKWSSSRPNLQRQKWATCGSRREIRLCSIFDSTAKNLEGSILTWLNDWANMAKSASLAQVTVVFHGCLDVTCHIESRYRKQMEACWVWPIGSHLVPTGGNALLGGTIVQLPSAHNPEAGICLVAVQFVRVCWRILC